MFARLGSAFGATALLLACSSLPDLQFVDAGTTDGGAVVGDAVAPTGTCSCQAVPAGWTPVTFGIETQTGCVAGTTASDLRVVDGDGTPSCNCSCNEVGGSCGKGDLMLTVTGEATCGVGAAPVEMSADSALCAMLNSPINVPAAAFAKVVHAPPASCAPTAALASPIARGRVCVPSSPATCGAGQACVFAPSAGFSSCITKSGTNACPADFPRRSTAGSTIDGSNACRGCACAAPSPCTGATVSVFDNQTCKSVGQSHGASNITSSCAATSASGFTGTYFKSTPPTGGGCGMTPQTLPTPGTLSISDARTICCK